MELNGYNTASMGDSSGYAEKVPLPAYTYQRQCDCVHDSQELYTTAELENYFGEAINDDNGTPCHQARSISRDPNNPQGYQQYLIPIIYATSSLGTILLHQPLVHETKFQYLLTATYSKIATIMCALVILTSDWFSRKRRGHARVKLAGLFPDTYEPIEADDDFRDTQTDISSRQRRQYTWKMFAFVLMDLLSQECWWLSLQMLPIEIHQQAQVAYPLLAVLMTWQWVLDGKTEMLARIIGGEQSLLAPAIAVFALLLTVARGFEMTFEWWYCFIGVGLKAFRDVLAREIFVTTSMSSAELILLSSSITSFRSLAAYYNSPEYRLCWKILVQMTPGVFLKIFLTGICYGVAQLSGLGLLRLWDPIEGASAMTTPALMITVLNYFGYV